MHACQARMICTYMHVRAAARDVPPPGRATKGLPTVDQPVGHVLAYEVHQRTEGKGRIRRRQSRPATAM